MPENVVFAGDHRHRSRSSAELRARIGPDEIQSSGSHAPLAASDRVGSYTQCCGRSRSGVKIPRWSLTKTTYSAMCAWHVACSARKVDSQDTRPRSEKDDELEQ